MTTRLAKTLLAGVSVLLALLPAAPAVRAADMTAREVTQAVFNAAPGRAIDLSGRKLDGLDLAGLDFKRALLAGADLTGTDLTGANLTGVDLAGAHLDRATLIGADLSGADLTGATILRPAVFSSLDNNRSEAPRFHGANLTDVRIVANRLDGADFSNADMTRAILGPVDYAWGEERYAQRSVMLGCDFSGARLHNANLINGVYQFANFKGADMTGVLLAGADLSKADLTGADLTGADLTGANLDEAILSKVKGYDTIRGLASAHNIDRMIR